MNRRVLMILNHSLYKTGRYTQSEALKAAWKLIKNPLTISAKGVSFGKRQTALQHLAHYPRHFILLDLIREQNPFDENAVAVHVLVVGKGSYQVGYLPRELAQIIAPLLDRGVNIPAQFESVTGGRGYGNYGLRMKVRVA